MKTVTLKNDIRVFCAAARSFPYGIGGALADLEQRLPAWDRRNLFGLSRRADNGLIVYQAAASEAYRGEAERYSGETHVIPQGEYLAITLPDWRGRGTRLSHTFDRLLSHPRSAKDQPCVEWYDACGRVVCMVRMV